MSFSIFLAGCTKESEDADPVVGNTITYSEDKTNFSNPERGFYGQDESGSSSSSLISQAYFDQLKNKNITLVRKLYSMTTFRSGPISSSYLQHIQDDLDLVRSNGFKVVLRFAYTFNEPAPWDDAPLDVILAHIEQLTPVLQKNADVIALMEAGFIGRWGEWHTSSNNLANTADMKTILYKVLDALPKSRGVAVRTQQQKIAIYETINPIGAAEAFNQSNRSRTGHHNDCFLASDTDWGTYWPNDPASLAAQKNYLNQENKYLPQEGETCNCNSPRSDCAVAISELEKMRWSALNKEYIDCVLDSWVTKGCYETIARRLGYRFRLLTSKIQDSVKLDSVLTLNLVLKNDGFASPYNARDIELVLRPKSGSSVKRIKLDADPRTWLPDNGEIKLSFSVPIPSGLTTGKYDLLLNFPDPETTLNTNPAYSIRLANQKVWEASTGYNSLLTSVTIIE